jgi:hypothetical protein
MDQVVFDFLNAQSQAPEYPGTVSDTITNPNRSGARGEHHSR